MTKRQAAILKACASLRRLNFKLMDAWNKPRSMAAISRAQDEIRLALYAVEPDRKPRRRKGGKPVTVGALMTEVRPVIDAFSQDSGDANPMYEAIRKKSKP